MGKYTKADIKYIARAIKRQSETGIPFSFLTGAGCSRSAGIPLASELISNIQEEYSYLCNKKLSTEQKDSYGAHMHLLSPSERDALIKPHLRKSKINWGHLAIACMMQEGLVGRVLTFNFDTILARACGFLGFHPATYDFVSSVTSRTDYISSSAILYLHGQDHGLGLLNTDEETQNHSKALQPLFEGEFFRSPTLVIGYSGKSDAAFETICSLHTGMQRLFWIGYDEEYEPHIETFIDSSPYNDFYGGADSDLFLMDLANELNCWPPKILTDPYGHLLDILDPIALYPQSNLDILAELKATLDSSREI